MGLDLSIEATPNDAAQGSKCQTHYHAPHVDREKMQMSCPTMFEQSSNKPI